MDSRSCGISQCTKFCREGNVIFIAFLQPFLLCNSCWFRRLESCNVFTTPMAFIFQESYGNLHAIIVTLKKMISIAMTITKLV